MTPGAGLLALVAFLVLPVLPATAAPAATGRENAVDADDVDAVLERSVDELDAVLPTLGALRGHHAYNRRNILAVAEKVDPAGYDYRPTEDVRSIGELLAHIADANYFLCSIMAGQENPLGPEAAPSDRNRHSLEASLEGKPEILGALRESYDYCEDTFESLAHQDLARPRMESRPLAPGGAAVREVVHSANHYGNLVVYLRLQGLTPPSSEGRSVPGATEEEVSATPSAPAAIEMELFYMVFLHRGPQWTAEPSPEVQELQEGHMANIRALAQSGSLVVAGPFDNPEAKLKGLAGIFVLRAASADDALALMDSDPAVAAGRFEVEILPWYAPKALKAF